MPMAAVAWQSFTGGFLFVFAAVLATRLVRPIFRRRNLRRWQPQ